VWHHHWHCGHAHWEADRQSGRNCFATQSGWRGSDQVGKWRQCITYIKHSCIWIFCMQTSANQITETYKHTLTHRCSCFSLSLPGFLRIRISQHRWCQSVIGNDALKNGGQLVRAACKPHSLDLKRGTRVIAANHNQCNANNVTCLSIYTQHQTQNTVNNKKVLRSDSKIPDFKP